MQTYVLLPSIPTAKNDVWQDLVDINKVYRAPYKLKDINPLYHKIWLPVDASKLGLHLSISEHVGTEITTDEDKSIIDRDDDEGDEKDPMVRKVEKDEEA